MELKKVGLGPLPDSIGNLKNLRILNLSDSFSVHCSRTLPNSIGDLTKLEELYLSGSRKLSELPEFIGNLENLRRLELKRTNLRSLPESMENLINLEVLLLSKIEGARDSERNYPADWYLEIINKSLQHWSCPTLDSSEYASTSSLDLSGKNLKQIPFGVYMMEGEEPKLKKLDVSNNQLTEIPHLLERLRWCLEKLYIHNNPNLNHLSDFLWEMSRLKELKIDGKLIKDLPKNAEYHLDNDNLEDSVLGLTLAGKNKAGMSDQDLSNKTGPYIVHLRNQ